MASAQQWEDYETDSADYNSDYNSDDDVLSVIEEEMRSHGATDESGLEDGEVEEADKSLWP